MGLRIVGFMWATAICCIAAIPLAMRIYPIHIGGSIFILLDDHPTDSRTGASEPEAPVPISHL